MKRYIQILTDLTVLVGGSWMTNAEDAVATALDFSEVPRLAGQWRVTLDLNGNEIDLYPNVEDINGKVGATIDTERQPEIRAIETITKTEAGVDFEFAFSMGDQSFTLHLVVKESAGSLSGTLREENGLFAGEVSGKRGSLEESDAKRAAPTEARLRFGDDKVRVTFGSLKMDSPDYATLNVLSDDALYTYVGSRATKLFTDTDLQFGATTVKAHKISANYPGVYSLWLKRQGDTWSLVFNEQPDIWGTQHDADFDVATVPLTAKKSSKAQERFLVTLKEVGDGGQLTFAWGDTIWSTPFSAVQ